MTQEKNKGGRPIEYPDSPLHIYWREVKRRDKRIAEEAKAEALAALKEES